MPGRARTVPAAPTIQRTAKFVKGDRRPDVNPAQQISENKIPDADLYFGKTDFFLNQSLAVGDALSKNFKGPLITSTPRADRGVDCKFSSVPDNEGSYKMHLLTPLQDGKWTHVTEKKNVLGRFPTMTDCKKKPNEDVNFIVKAKADQPAQTETHEGKHADDYEDIFNKVVVPWDQGVTKAMKSGAQMAGKDAPACEQQLYTLARQQQPDKILENFATTFNKRSNDFHGTAAGRKPNISIVRVGDDCNAATVKID
jgi:hypothetical protein